MPHGDDQIRRVLDKRYPVLEYLADGPARKPKLVATLNGSRSTIDRSIGDLIEIRYVRKMDDQYVATTAGRLALREYEKYRRATDAVTSTAELLNHLPNDSPIGTDLLKGASVTMGAEHAPDQALAPSIDLFERATRMRGLAPVVLSFYPNLIAGRLSEGDITAEIIAESDVLDVLPELPSIGDAALSNTEGLSLYESHRELPYAVVDGDTRRQLHRHHGLRFGRDCRPSDERF